MTSPVSFDIPGSRSTMHGVANTYPEMEYAVVEHVLPCGGVIRETILRPVPPPPAVEPQDAAQEAAANG